MAIVEVSDAIALIKTHLERAGRIKVHHSGSRVEVLIVADSLRDWLIKEAAESAKIPPGEIEERLKTMPQNRH